MRFVRLSGIVMLGLGLVLSGCASEKAKNRAKEAAARYWQDKAYPGKAHDVQVIEAETADDGMYRVKGLIDGETRVGMFNPETEVFGIFHILCRDFANAFSKDFVKLKWNTKGT